MKKLLLLGLSTFAVSAHAWEPTYYLGSSFSPWKAEMHSLPVDFSIQTVEAVGGIVLFPHISLEARVGAGINEGRDSFYFTRLEDADEDPDTDDVVVLNEAAIATEIKYFASAYFRPFISNDRATLYGLLGVTSVETETKTNFEDDSIEGYVVPEDYSDTAVSYGIGVSFSMSPNIDLTAEWKKLINADEFDVRGGSIGFTYSF